MFIVLLGPPGSGKGTQAELLCKKFNLFHFSTGNILRNEVSNKTKFGKEIETIINAGKLISDKLIIRVVDNQVTDKFDSKKGILFDGFPRNLSQAKVFNTLLKNKKKNLDYVIQLVVNKLEIIKRIKKRKIQDDRKDDDVNILKSRLDVYFNETEPLLKFYKNINLLHEIDGMQSIEDVNNDLNSVILSSKNT